MIEPLVEQLVATVVKNAELLTQQGKYGVVTYVENETFTDGVYRVHLEAILPLFLKTLRTENVVELVDSVAVKYDNVIFDKSSLWLTIYPEKKEVFSE